MRRTNDWAIVNCSYFFSLHNKETFHFAIPSVKSQIWVEAVM